MTIRPAILLAAVALLAPGTAVAHQGAHPKSLAEAKALAAEHKQLLLLDFFAET